MSYPITPEVEAISRLHIEGNVIPHTWFQHIRTPAGHPDVLAIMILSDVVYWYRWRELRDEATGAVVGYARRFKGDRLQRSYDALAQQYGFTKRQVQDAVYRLVDAGLLARDLRTIITDNGVKLGNVLYLAPIADAIAAITYHADHPLSRKNVRQIQRLLQRLQQRLQPSDPASTATARTTLPTKMTIWTRTIRRNKRRLLLLLLIPRLRFRRPRPLPRLKMLLLVRRPRSAIFWPRSASWNRTWGKSRAAACAGPTRRPGFGRCKGKI